MEFYPFKSCGIAKICKTFTLIRCGRMPSPYQLADRMGITREPIDYYER